MDENAYNYNSNESSESKSDKLLTFVKENKVKELKELIDQHKDMLNVKFPKLCFKSIIPIAGSHFFKEVKPETVEELINIGYKINSKDAEQSHVEELIFFAAAGAYPQKLTEVLVHMNNEYPGKLNNTRDGDSALMFLVKYGNFRNSKLPMCAKLLVDTKIDVNIPDYHNCTPILKVAHLYHIHAKKDNNPLVLQNLEKVVHIILETKKADIDSHKIHEKSAKWYIDNFENLNTPPDNFALKKHLFSLVIAKEENEIRTFILPEGKSYDMDDGDNTLLQLACILNLKNVVEHFLKENADPNFISARNKTKPLDIAAEMNHLDIFIMLLSCDKTKIDKDTYIQYATRMEKKYFICLLNSTKLEVDVVCNKLKNTPLHYAGLYSENEAVLKLLRRGANVLEPKNTSGKRPIDCIDPKILEEFFDECIEANNFEDVYSKTCKISFNNIFFLQGASKISKTTLRTDQRSHISWDVNVQENSTLDVLLAISDIWYMRNLLKHPLTLNFLRLMWCKINKLFWVVLLFRVWCYSIFMYYIYSKQEKATTWIYILTLLMYSTFVFLKICFNLIFQRSVLLDIQMWVEYFMCGVVLLRAYADDNQEMIKFLKFFVLTLSAYSLTLFTGNHPNMSFSVAVLKKVSCRFIKILLSYAILIISFAINFYIQFSANKSSTEHTLQEQNIQYKNNTQEFKPTFENFSKSLVKFLMHLLGQSPFNFENSTLNCYIIFLMFEFMISSILINLVMGVAVANTETIQNKSEVAGHMVTVKFIQFALVLAEIHVGVGIKQMILDMLKRCFSIRPTCKISCCCKFDRKIMKRARNIIIGRKAVKCNEALQIKKNITNTYEC